MLRAFGVENGTLDHVDVDPGAPLPPEAVWVDLATPTREEEAVVEAALGIDIPTRDEASGLQVSDRLIVAGGTIYMSAFVVPSPPTVPPVVPLTFVCAGDKLVTVRYSRLDSLDPFIAKLSSGQAGRLEGAGDVFAGLLELIVDRLAERMEELGEHLHDVGRDIFRDPHMVAQRAGRPIPLGRRIHRLEAVIKELGRQHQVSTTLRQSLHSMIRLVAFSEEHASDGMRHRLRSVAQDLKILSDLNGHFEADLSFMLDSTVGLIDTQQNKVIYLLSILSIVLTPPVLIASVYGMNFQHMPELAWPWGYAYALTLMLVSALGPFLFFKFKGWL
ncbi:MAG: CorA family divalent cation transporter [Geminicoccaceae bacterium]